jgi:uncharacterized protein
MTCAVIIMAKAPIAGYAKTRLIPALGVEGSAALAKRLLNHTVDQALEAAIGPIDLCCAPDIRHPAFSRHALPEGIELSSQGEGDLGARMSRALDRWIHGGPAILVGTDAPAIDATMLRRASRALNDHDIVFIPTHDGGYALVGLRRPVPQLFTDMIWSTATVMQQTRERLVASGLRHAELPAVADIDCAVDLHHLPTEWLTTPG